MMSTANACHKQLLHLHILILLRENTPCIVNTQHNKPKKATNPRPVQWNVAAPVRGGGGLANHANNFDCIVNNAGLATHSTCINTVHRLPKFQPHVRPSPLCKMQCARFHCPERCHANGCPGTTWTTPALIYRLSI